MLKIAKTFLLEACAMHNLSTLDWIHNNLCEQTSEQPQPWLSTTCENIANMHWDPRSQLNTPGLRQRRLERADVCRPALCERFGLSKHDTSLTLTSRITQSQPTDVFCRSLQERRHPVSLCSRFGSLQTIARPVAAARTFEQPPCRLQKTHGA